MSPKTNGKASLAPSQKKESVKKGLSAAPSHSTTIASKSDGSKSEKKAALKSEKPTVTVEAIPVDLDELEENEETAANASAGGGNAAALAAAGSNTEMSASFKNFRHHPDMENFYRFIFENDLRHEALAIIDEIMAEKQQRKFVKISKTQPH